MSDLTNYGEGWAADILFGDAAKDTTLFVSELSAITDAEASTVTELAAFAATRVPWGAITPVNGRIPNNIVIDFGNATGGGVSVGMALWESNAGGTPVLVKAHTPKTIESGDPTSYPVGSLGFTLA